LREEVAQLRLEVSEARQTKLSLKTQLEEDHAAVLKVEQALMKRHLELEAVTKERDGLYEKVKQLENTINVLSSEIKRRDVLLETVGANMKELESTNKHLTDTLLRMKSAEAQRLDAETSQVDAFARGQLRAIERGDEAAVFPHPLKLSRHVSDSFKEVGSPGERRSSELGVRRTISADVDYTSSDSILMSASFQERKECVPAGLKRQLSTRHSQGPAPCVRYSRSGLLLASGGSDGLVRVWDARTGGQRGTLRGMTGAVFALAFAYGDEGVLATSGDGRVCLWDLHTKKTQVFLGHTKRVTACAFKSETDAITGSSDRTLRTWDVRTAQSSEIQCESACNALSVFSDGDLFASGHVDCAVRFWSPKIRGKVCELKNLHGQQCTGVEFSKYGNILATLGRDNVVHIVDVRTYRTLRSLGPHLHDPGKSVNSPSHPRGSGSGLGAGARAYVNGVNWGRAVLSPADQFVAAGSADGTIHVWQTETGTLQAVLTSDSSRGGEGDVSVNGLDWNTNGFQIASSDGLGAVRLWE
jgi:autophagy-related protein 16